MNVHRFVSSLLGPAARRPIIRARFLSVLLFVGLVALAARAQTPGGFGPWTRFGGNNYSNGSSSYPGPSSVPQIAFSVNTNGSSSVPVVAPNGKVVVSNGAVSCFSSTGAPIWSTANSGGYPGGGYPGGGYPGGGFSYGTANPDPPAIGSDGTVYVTTATSPGSPVRSIVALDLNAPGPSASVKWAYSTSNNDGPAGSPVVGPDNTVYCVGQHLYSGGAPYVFAYKAGALKWSWKLPDLVIVGEFRQPILYSDQSGTYLIASGVVQRPSAQQGIYPSQYYTLSTVVLRDDGTVATQIGNEYSFPVVSFSTDPNAKSADYLPNGSLSLSPDGASLIVPWVWESGSNLSGVACLNINVPTGNMSMRWPTLNSSANVPPPMSAVDAVLSSPPAPKTYSAAIDSIPYPNTGVYTTTALGNSLLKRSLADGTKLWQTGVDSASGRQLLTLDKSNTIWAGTNDGHVLSYDPNYGNLLSSTNVGNPVNSIDRNGIGVSVGTSSDLFLTTTPSSGSAQLLRLH